MDINFPVEMVQVFPMRVLIIMVSLQENNLSRVPITFNSMKVKLFSQGEQVLLMADASHDKDDSSSD